MTLTPKEQGFIMPAEWESHSAVWLAWPYDETTFPNRVAKVEKIYCQMIKALQGSERVELLVLPAMKSHVEEILERDSVDSKRISFHTTDYADVWIRDYAPIFLLNRKEKKLAWLKTQYNAYGKAEDPYYEPLLKDNKVFERVTPPGEKFKLDIVLEGGSIEVNGEGVLITTEQCLLNPNRNPQLSKKQIEEYLKDYLAVNRILWLKQGLINDHTDGHIDDLVKFVTPNKMLVAYEDDAKDENYPILKNNFEALAKEQFEVVKLPMPHLRYDDGAKAPVSYANFYIGNEVVLLPRFNDPSDRKAYEIIKPFFPDKKIVGIDCRDLIYGGGAIHCILQQQPSI